MTIETRALPEKLFSQYSLDAVAVRRTELLKESLPLKTHERLKKSLETLSRAQPVRLGTESGGHSK